jgi:hypothetical protein
MKLKLSINRHTTDSELVRLGHFINAIAAERAAQLAPFTAPTDPAELNAAEYFVVVPPANDTEQQLRGGTDAPKRRRRTKAEIEAANAAADTAPSGEVVEVRPEPAPLSELSAPTPTAPVTDTAPTEPAPAASEPAAASPSKSYTEAEVQDLAGKVARATGPEVVKAKIAELGAARIAELTQEQRDSLGAFLITKLP